MTRRIVYGVGLWITIAATAMTIASIVMPRWLSYSSEGTRQFSYGLHRRCSSVTGECDHFPRFEDCTGDKWSFCSMWRTVGFLMSFAVILELATLTSYAIIILGGKQRRDRGWKVVCAFLVVSALVELVSMALVSFLFDHDDRFFNGWYLDKSWVLCTVSWSMLVTTAAGVVAAAIYLPEEGGYELIPNEGYGIGSP
ncbi:hypothetical protein BU16DRAFT_465228 [Lophium mytilinum]|uniref:Pre-mRNA splicing factor n=1 Tax=Lophium mytilinum TaxID=390894 RepID=A0A6A6QNA8_9PEZI|nr:hypothetical protein BU16DRAFT_465228 [Lophium mytilinum]